MSTVRVLHDLKRGYSHRDDLEEDYHLTSSASGSSTELASRMCFLCNLTASVQCHCSCQHTCQEAEQIFCTQELAEAKIDVRVEGILDVSKKKCQLFMM